MLHSSPVLFVYKYSTPPVCLGRVVTANHLMQPVASTTVLHELAHSSSKSPTIIVITLTRHINVVPISDFFFFNRHVNDINTRISTLDSFVSFQRKIISTIVYLGFQFFLTIRLHFRGEKTNDDFSSKFSVDPWRHNSCKVSWNSCKRITSWQQTELRV